MHQQMLVHVLAEDKMKLADVELNSGTLVIGFFFCFF